MNDKQRHSEIDTSKTVVTILPSPDGGAVLALSYAGAKSIRASVQLNDDIIDYLLINLPKYYRSTRNFYGPTGPH